MAIPGTLPSWSRDERASIEEKAREYRSLSADERGDRVALACRAAAKTLAHREPDDLERVLAFTDPLPSSTKAALARLRAKKSR